ncbi:MAG: two-component sensor histidine kinase [Desulfobacter sp.]|nr:two-component sensor histidine kinase [Desulfobacter sp.]WDP87434.1 MAG: two-component sensor histidine kinase [Desulfobacter sp.]
MEEPLADRKGFYQILTRKIRVLILVVSFVPMMLTAGILCYRFHQAYSEKVSAHISELVLKHTQNIDAFLLEKLGNIRYLARQFSESNPESAQTFLVLHLARLKEEYGDVFTDLGLVNTQGIQFAYEGPFRFENADYSRAKWFVRSMESPYYISDVFAGLRGHPHFILAVKVTCKKQDYILRATINFTAFNSLVENIQIGKTGAAYIVNTKGEFQTHARSGTSAHIAPAMVAKDVFSDNNTVVMKKADIQGNAYIYALSIFKNIDWRMVFRQDLDDAMRDLWRAEMLSLGIFVIGCIAILSVSFTLPRSIVKLIAAADKKNEAMNKQVVESGKLATIGELAAGIAHEINNPVAIMVEEAGWMGDLLEEPFDDTTFDEFNRAIEQIKTQGRRCKDITHKLLSFARKSDATVADIRINEVIQQIVSLTAQMARYNNVSIQTRLGPELPYIRVSPAELQQVVLNLVNNAIDAMGKEGGIINIDTCVNPEDSQYVLVEFSDNGPGIPSQNLARIFDPFFTTKAVGKGTGLGLSICYGIIRKMGGKIEVKSIVGQGTSFFIFLPIDTKNLSFGKKTQLEQLKNQGENNE